MAYRNTTGRYKKNVDLTTSEGLSRLADSKGGALADKADKITGEKKSIFSKVGDTLKKGLGKTLDVLQRANYAIAGSVKSVVDKDTTTNPFNAFAEGITGRSKHTFTDVFEDVGWKPTSFAGKAAKGVSGFALDVLLDPTTYVTFGASAGVKVGLKAGEKTLSKAGTKLLAKGVAQKAGQEFGEDFVKTAIARMADSSPELYKKFIDQGGVKFFGQTLISGGRIAGVVKALPGMTKLDEATLPIRNTLGALFNRDISATYGKLPREFIDLRQRLLDISSVRSADAVNGTIDIAKANKLTANEANMITDAIEAKLPLADARLENARKLMEQKMGRSLKNEQMAGIPVGELPNYVPHILVDEPVKNLPFKPEGVRVSLGAAKERTIEGTVSEINERFGGEFFDPNIVNTVAIRSLASARAVSAAEFLREVAAKFGKAANQAPSNYVESAVKELKGFKFHPQIVEQVDNFKKGFIGDQATNNLLKAFDKAQGLWKASVTSIFPAFHGRNAVSNVFLNYLDIGSAALSPARHFLSTTLLRDDNTFKSLERAALGIGEEADKAKTALKELSDKIILTDDFGKKWNFGELRTVIKDNRVAFGDEFTGFMDVRENIAGKLEGATPKAGAVTPEAPILSEARGKTLEEFVKSIEAKNAPLGASASSGDSPRVLYHGTSETIKGPLGTKEGLWVTENPEIAKRYIGNGIQNIKGTVEKVVIPPNVKIYDDFVEGEFKNNSSLKDLADYYGKKGYDAVRTNDFVRYEKSPGNYDGEYHPAVAIFPSGIQKINDFKSQLTSLWEQAQKAKPSVSQGSGTAKKVLKAVNPFSQDNLAFRAGRNIGNKVEQQARVLNFVTNLEKTGDVMTSAKRTKQFIFDYTNLSDFEKNVMRRLIPFYTFTRKNLELQVTQLAKQPGKFATQAKLFTSLSKAISGGTLTDKERSNLPQFLQEGLGIVVSRDKNNVQVINSVGSPLEQIFSNLKPNAILGSLSPILAVPLQVAIGKHFFFDRDLKDVNNASAYQDAPQFIKDYIGYTTRKNKDGSIRHIALNPTRLFILSNIPPSSRVVSTIAQIEEENVSGKLKIIRQLTGLKPYGADLDRQEAINEKNKVRELQDLLDEAGVAPIFRRSFIPK